MKYYQGIGINWGLRSAFRTVCICIYEYMYTHIYIYIYFVVLYIYTYLYIYFVVYVLWYIHIQSLTVELFVVHMMRKNGYFTGEQFSIHDFHHSSTILPMPSKMLGTDRCQFWNHYVKLAGGHWTHDLQHARWVFSAFSHYT